MIMMDLQEVLRVILGSYRVQFLALERGCSSPEASALDFLFRDQLYEGFDYSAFAAGIMDLAYEDNVIDYKDSFGLHYIVFQGRGAEKAIYNFCGPYTYRANGGPNMIHYVSEFSVTDDLRETLRKENSDFPFSANELNVIEYVNNCAKWHWHGFVEFSFVVEGAVECCTPSGTIIARAGEGYFINTNVLHMVRMASDATDAKYRVLQFETRVVGGTDGIYAKYIAPVENCKRLEAFKLSLDNSGHHAALAAMAELFQIAAQEPPCYELAALNKIIELWSRLYILVKSVLQEEQPISDASADRVKQMLAFIHANYADAICVDAIAASANVSKREAFRSFKQVLGTTPTLYLLQHRVNRAARRLMETSQSITEISSACGFSTPSYFTKVFHDLTGVSPRDFRRRSRG